jgi:hypothetical protein
MKIKAAKEGPLDNAAMSHENVVPAVVAAVLSEVLQCKQSVCFHVVNNAFDRCMRLACSDVCALHPSLNLGPCRHASLCTFAWPLLAQHMRVVAAWMSFTREVLDGEKTLPFFLVHSLHNELNNTDQCSGDLRSGGA